MNGFEKIGLGFRPLLNNRGVVQITLIIDNISRFRPLLNNRGVVLQAHMNKPMTMF